jgi:pimeloyl-ACP methyl ester carboxylesterase
MHRSAAAKHSIALALAAIFLFLASLANAVETRVQVAADLAGAWLAPDAKWNGQTVILLHGFADDMNGPGDASKRLAEKLAGAGIASLRINFRGEGDRRRSDIRSTFATRVADTEAAHEFVIKSKGVNAAHLAVLGWSLGGATAIEVAGRHPDWFRALVLWSSLSGSLEKFMFAMEGARIAVREGSYTQDYTGWKKVTTHRDYYESFRGIDLDRSLAKYPGAFLSVRGSQDFLPQYEAQFLKIARGRPAEAVLIGGADHVFNALDPKAKEADAAIAATLAWLTRTL